MLHCDSCGKGLGTYLFGKGGIEERARIFETKRYAIPDVVCNECWNEGYSVTNPKNPLKVYGEKYKERKQGI